MQIIKGKTAGFCEGVNRAVECAEKNLKKTTGKIYCLGEIVHNKEVIKQLEQKGLQFIEKLEEADNTTIIRAHGVAQEIYEKAKEKGIELKDYTCPHVLKIHKIAEEYSQKGYCIFLTGTKNHPENIGTISYCGKNYEVIEQVEELDQAIKKLKKTGIEKLLVISQTTYSLEKFNTIVKKIESELKHIQVVIKNTICRTTQVRQEETKKIAKQVEAIIICGGKHSSNTRKLFEIASKYCNYTYYIETMQELQQVDWKQYNRIGIMAGASTPQEEIEEVIKYLEEV